MEGWRGKEEGRDGGGNKGGKVGRWERKRGEDAPSPFPPFPPRSSPRFNVFMFLTSPPPPEKPSPFLPIAERPFPCGPSPALWGAARRPSSKDTPALRLSPISPTRRRYSKDSPATPPLRPLPAGESERSRRCEALSPEKCHVPSSLSSSQSRSPSLIHLLFHLSTLHLSSPVFLWLIAACFGFLRLIAHGPAPRCALKKFRNRLVSERGGTRRNKPQHAATDRNTPQQTATSARTCRPDATRRPPRPATAP